jgi:hypothetical protein
MRRMMMMMRMRTWTIVTSSKKVLAIGHVRDHREQRL